MITFKSEEQTLYDIVELTTDAPVLDDVIEVFKRFLMGCGYAPESVQEICRVPEDEDYSLPKYDLEDFLDCEIDSGFDDMEFEGQTTYNDDYPDW